MSTIRATCPTCARPVDLEPAQVLLLTRPEPAASGTYLFSCVACEQVVVKPARSADVALLVEAGVIRTRPSSQPAAPAGPSGHQWQARPFTRDDLLDFHLLLNTDDWLARLHTANDRPVA
jgi:hypothetical protein